MEDAPDFIPETLSPEEPDLAEAPLEPVEPAPPITSRFLYVDVAALRAKQLRRGARLRYELEPGLPLPKKPERQAMEEVRRCLVQYSVPPWKGGATVEEAEQADDA
jgi:DNA-directed RNA polymerase subunit K/omega